MIHTINIVIAFLAIGFLFYKIYFSDKRCKKDRNDNNLYGIKLKINDRWLNE